jgi:hypothetical protein
MSNQVTESLITEIYVPFFHEQGESAIKTICNSKVPMQVFLTAYQKVAPIPPEEVEELFAYATELYPEETEYFRNDVAKVVYTLSKYL